MRIASDLSHQEMYDKMPPKLQDHYKQLGTIMTTPNLKEAFGASMEQQFVRENFDFLSLVQQYEKTSNPHEKLALAEKIYKLVESPENPPSRSGIQQINLSASMAGKITEGIEHLRQAIVPGQEPSEADKQLLNDLFAQSKGEIVKLSKPALENFIGGHSFKAEAAKAHSAKVSGESSSVPSSRLAPGSGEAFNTQVDSFTSIPKLMGDPEIRAAYKQHLSGAPSRPALSATSRSRFSPSWPKAVTSATQSFSSTARRCLWITCPKTSAMIPSSRWSAAVCRGSVKNTKSSAETWRAASDRSSCLGQRKTARTISCVASSRTS
ncbi:regulator of G-protein signaling domain-containing protein [Verrucomicrobium spinosum]|uniref:regulator of G-protein signaling domain-containing protein n=1 Tax=Verrucomicrobium spinosum TaxID=2736 RepID=UPI0009462ABD|nr:regulator of G-protein signaling domain-containing protein [Verrucomicrobium spinosum]